MRIKSSKKGYISISLLLAGGCMGVILYNLLAQTLCMSRLVQDFDQMRQEINLEYSLANIIQAAAYEALEPKIEGTVQFRLHLENQLKEIYPDAVLVDAPDFSQYQFFPYNKHEIAGSSTIKIYLENREYIYNLIVSINPISKYRTIAYSLPVTGSVPDCSPDRIVKVDCLSKECLFSAKGDIYDEISFIHRKEVSLFWNLYEYLFSPEYQEALYHYAGSNCIDMTQKYLEALPKGIDYEFEARTLDLDLANVESECLSIVDPLGWGTIHIHDSGGNERPMVLQILNLQANRSSKIIFVNSSTRPVLFYCVKGDIKVQSDQLRGAFFLGKDCTWAGGHSVLGHLSFYAPGPAPSITTFKDDIKDLNPYLPKVCDVKVTKN